MLTYTEQDEAHEARDNEQAARLWLSEQQWLNLLERIEREAREQRQSTVYGGAERRNDGQQRYSVALVCVMRVQFPEGGSATYQLPCRDLSNGGMGFYAPHALPKNARCTAAFRRDDGGGLVVAGRVAWCREEDERLFRVGLSFEEPIDVEACLDPDAQRGA